MAIGTAGFTAALSIVEMERNGQVFVHCERDTNGQLTVRVGGNAVQVMEGELYT